MGQKDLTEKNLEYYPDVFADIVNALLYQGNQIVNSNELLPAPTETMYYSQSGKLRNQFHDVSKFATKHGTIQVQYTLENETRAARKMIFRRIGYEGAVYREQLDCRSDYPFIGLMLPASYEKSDGRWTLRGAMGRTGRGYQGRRRDYYVRIVG